MLLFITPNPCVERTLQVEKFEAGRVHRVPIERLDIQAGGKAINAARVAQNMGAKVLCTGWIGQNQLDWFELQMARETLAHDWVAVENDTRVCVNILSETEGVWTKTELVEAGAPISIENGTRLLQTVEHWLPQCELIIIGGSYPPGENAGFDLHASVLVRLAHKFGRKVVFDGKNRAWEIAIRGPSNVPKPWCITPNLDELQALLQREISGEDAERRALNDVLKRGIEVVLLTCGARGCWLATRENLLFLQAPTVREVSAVGSGDSLVGAFCSKYFESANLPEADRLLEAARWGVAAGSANAAQMVSARVTRDDIAALLPQVQVRRVQQMLPMAR